MQCEDGVVVLQEKPGDEFEPTEDEVRNYGEWLGMDPEQDRDLFHIAREGLKAPLTDGWKPCQNAEGEIFYFNFETGSSSWDHPADDMYRRIVAEKKREKREGGALNRERKTEQSVPVVTNHTGNFSPRRAHAQALGGAPPRRCALFRRFPCCKRRLPTIPPQQGHP
mmetsp:Transcript_95683/g.270789  ORF Transcript_95683/g.270789 Transcript_95683/m.270789 type:complete len:167 (-) Transcript_95683:194-694(-)